jgi:hypothetical protein
MILQHDTQYVYLGVAKVLISKPFRKANNY